jgi:hypothetical protein
MDDLQPYQIVAMVLGCLIVIAIPAWIAYSYFGSRKAVTDLLDKVGASLSLARVPATATIWEAGRKTVGLGAQPVAQGQRRGIPVELTYLPKAGAVNDEATTKVRLIWPTSVAVHVALDREATRNEDNRLLERHPGLGKALTLDPGDAQMRWINDPWFGPSMVTGSQAELDRVLNPTVRDQLKTFPRKLAVVLFYGRLMEITWYGLESDPSVVAQAFDLGIACLERLAPRSP